MPWDWATPRSDLELKITSVTQLPLCPQSPRDLPPTPMQTFAQASCRVLLEVVWLRTDCLNVKIRIAHHGAVRHKVMRTCTKQTWWYPPQNTACSWLPRLSKQSYSQSHKDSFKQSLSQNHYIPHSFSQLSFFISCSKERAKNRKLAKWITKAEISALYHSGEMLKVLP